MTFKIALCALALALVAGCGGPKKAAADKPAPDIAVVKEEAPVEPAIVAEREHIDRNATAPYLPPESKVGGNEGQSPFVGDRVIGLNAIVKQSLEVVHEFDTKAPAIRQAVDAAVSPSAGAAIRDEAAEGMKTLNALYDRSKSALDEMQESESNLKASGEYFDEVIFYGMMKFVIDVESEVRETRDALTAKLAGAPAP